MEAVGGKGATTGTSPLSLTDLAQILFYSAGLIRKAYLRSAGEVHYRAAASAGALYPIDIYVVCQDVEGLEAGVYHFSAADFSLGQLRKGDFRGEFSRAAGDDPEVASSPVSLVFTANFWRSAWKYRARGYRYCFWDCGTILSNLLAVSRSLGLPSRISLGFVDGEVDRLLGIDPKDEAGLCIVTLGEETSGAAATNGPTSLDDITTGYNLAGDQTEYHEVTRAACRGSVGDAPGSGGLEDNGLAGRERRHRQGTGTPVVASANTGNPVGQVINDRGSTRRSPENKSPWRSSTRSLQRPLSPHGGTSRMEGA